MGNVGAVFLFEWKRAFTWQRMLWWWVLALFPVFIVGLVVFTVERDADVPGVSDDMWVELCVWLLFALVPMLVAMLGTLLWATPAVSAELERRSWVYLAVRPHGGTAVLLGKYLASVTWVIPPAILGLTVSVLLCQFARPEQTLQVWWTMVRLILLSAPAYAAIYLLLGVVMPRRAMVLAVAYTLIFELIISFVPAVINKFTVQYRLRSLAAEWCQVSLARRDSPAMQTLIGSEPPWQHVGILILFTTLLVAGSVVLLRACEFSSAAESDM
ncbi:ABC transporter permease [Schlesneria sp. DSM 10557]|uniref:ABC transporter permease n=1 Tax=Schlesneria sp. DSM 10557 TaxID=3044399 RepID=UPI00359FDA5E